MPTYNEKYIETLLALETEIRTYFILLKEGPDVQDVIDSRVKITKILKQLDEFV